MPEASIRPLAAGEIPALVELAARIWRAHYAGMLSQAQIDYMLAQRYRPQLIASQLDDPGQRWLAAAAGPGLVGYAHVYPEEAQRAKLDKLYVAPECQRRGLGRALLAAAEDSARAWGARRLIVRTNKANAQALAAYARYGFGAPTAVVEDIGGGFIMDDYQLEKTL